MELEGKRGAVLAENNCQELEICISRMPADLPAFCRVIIQALGE